MAKSTSASPPAKQPNPTSNSAAMRETIESIAIAFILAFLFRTFEAEAFVIPTGSMATTLKGRNKDLECPMCHFNFQVSASEEVERDGSAKKNDMAGGPRRAFSPMIDICVCPNCRFEWDGKTGPKSLPSYNGDRILVNKFAYQFDDPRRWDVIVFKYPQKSQENYIKRLVGLPGETLKIFRGDIFVSKDGNNQFEIVRKPPEKLRVMLQTVFDNDQMPDIAKEGWPDRWKPVSPHKDEKTGQWIPKEKVAFEIDGSETGESWLRYRHLVPSANQWAAKLNGNPPPADSVKPQLITDFTGYNTGSSDEQRNEPNQNVEPSGLNWVGDLAVECQADVQNDRGQIVLELVKGGKKFQCRIDVATGLAEVSLGGEKPPKDSSWQTTVKGPGKYDLMFANCDRGLYLWVNGESLPPIAYPDLKNGIPDESDLAPVGIASAGVKMEISRLKVFRDIHYIAVSGPHAKRNDYVRLPPNLGFALNSREASVEMEYLDMFFSDPRRWTFPVNDSGETMSYFDDENMSEARFPLGENKFFAMGDNSAKSADSRYWGPVARELLIGKAFYVYWPHSWDRVPGTSIPFPCFPNFARMGFVR
jgi:signal peptidase I